MKQSKHGNKSGIMAKTKHQIMKNMDGTLIYYWNDCKIVFDFNHFEEYFGVFNKVKYASSNMT